MIDSPSGYRGNFAPMVFQVAQNLWGKISNYIQQGILPQRFWATFYFQRITFYQHKNQSRHQLKLLSTKARHPSDVFLKFSSPVGRLPTINQSYHLTAVRLRQHRYQSRHQLKLISTKARHPSDVFLKFLSPVGRLPTINQSYHPTAVRLRQHRNQSRHRNLVIKYSVAQNLWGKISNYIQSAILPQRFWATRILTLNCQH